jgi:DNA-binding MarR family transcriptional regulator
MGVFDDLVRCETRLYNALNERLREQHGIVMSQFEYLNFLHVSPQTRVGDIAAAFAIGIGATSKGIDRLERLGWVERVANPADRRSSLLVLTEAGEQLVAEAQQTCDQRLAELLDVDEPHLAVLAEVFGALRRRLERGEIGTPIG